MKNILTRTALRSLADPRSYERGEEYYEMDAVGPLTEREGEITAKVEGTRTYKVKLWDDDGELDYSCTCPVGEDGDFCKHCVAVGLTWLSKGARVKAGKVRKPKSAEITMKDVEKYLDGLEKTELVKMLIRQIGASDNLREELFLLTAKRSTTGGLVATFKKIIDGAVRPDDFIEYREMYAYTDRIDSVVDQIEGLLKDGHAAEVIELTEHAISEAEAAMNSVDDSNGMLGGIINRLEELHLAACRKAKPESVGWAKYLPCPTDSKMLGYDA
jgi:uncharacterized Zn finger protein